MPGSHDLSEKNLRMHEHIVGTERTTQHIVRTVTSVPAAKKSARPPAKPETVARSKAASKAGSKADSKAGSKHETSKQEKEVLVVTVIEEDDDEVGLPPPAPSVAHASSKHDSKKATSAKPAASVASRHSHHSHHDRRDIFHIPAGIPPPPGFSKMPDFPSMPPMPPMREIPEIDVVAGHEMALMHMPPPPPARSVASGASRKVAHRYPTSHVSHHSKISHHSKMSSKSKAIEAGAGGKTESELLDVLVEEVHEVTRRRFVVKMPGDKVREWGFRD
ncbi:hypothetical protein M438DRAFT_280113 [Aureobasidium pullulans EXF-150]|uniref:Uncharacterized protein n=1 Tax=Aureobasidium pullulans EXF-150 TaxID=1043002 RepID=A0A074X6U8_AURPU|nr:uncharacterized protein M438DRAFT_280113 [Aureobasidium pullulans EXF-150]KEQ81225.1 hypothetical protein M438DRAFT_280113 [Aureobasidium pullulans EXF-150]